MGGLQPLPHPPHLATCVSHSHVLMTPIGKGRKDKCPSSTRKEEWTRKPMYHLLHPHVPPKATRWVDVILLSLSLVFRMVPPKFYLTDVWFWPSPSLPAHFVGLLQPTLPPKPWFLTAGKGLNPSKDPLRIKGLTNKGGAGQCNPLTYLKGTNDPSWRRNERNMVFKP